MSKKIVASLLMMAVAAAGAIGGTIAFFSDTETSSGNTFTAGAIDLKVDSTAHYNGKVCAYDSTDKRYEWSEGNSAYPISGQPCGLTWGQPNGKDIVAEKFFNFADVKPGDSGENTISLHVDGNDAVACLFISPLANLERSCNDPETEAETNPKCKPSNTGNNGELAQNINFFAWVDLDGDNIWETGETQLFTNTSGPASDVLAGKTYPLGPLAGNSTKFIGLQWCAGKMTVPTSPGPIGCSGAEMGNEAQTDTLLADIAFRVVQARNNEGFDCGENPLTVAPPLPVEIVKAGDLVENSGELAAAPNSWFFYNDTNDTLMTINQFSGTGGVNNFVTGPDSVGAAQMTLDTGTDPRYNIATYRYKNWKLADISSLKYRMYEPSPNGTLPYLHFNVDFNNSDTWQRRLVMVPTGVSPNTWTTVDALAGSWHLSGGNWPVGTTENGSNPGSNPKTWAQILAEYPNAETRSTDSWLGVRVGQPGPAAATGYVDWIEFDGEMSDFSN